MQCTIKNQCSHGGNYSVQRKKQALKGRDPRPHHRHAVGQATWTQPPSAGCAHARNTENGLDTVARPCVRGWPCWFFRGCEAGSPHRTRAGWRHARATEKGRAKVGTRSSTRMFYALSKRHSPCQGEPFLEIIFPAVPAPPPTTFSCPCRDTQNLTPSS